MAASTSTFMPGCPCLQYPRSLPSVLSAADRKHLTQLYFAQVHGQSHRRYYHLLHHLGRAKGDDATWRILEEVRERIATELGEGFVIINDFFSYRSASQRLFPTWHQDGEFWLADDGSGGSEHACCNFNLWILLDHRDMNYSFDLVEPDASNAWVYAALNARAFGAHAAALNFSAPHAWFKPEEARRLSRGGLAGLLPRDETQRVPQRVPRVSRVPLAAGDALVVKQLELHRTDDHALRPQQWRLALGFKVLRQGTVLRSSEPTSPFGADAADVRASWPGLLPEFTPGAPLPLVYDRRRLRALDPAAERPGWLAYLHTDRGLVLLAPLAFLALAVVFKLAARPRAVRDAPASDPGSAGSVGLLPSRARGRTERRREE